MIMTQQENNSFRELKPIKAKKKNKKKKDKKFKEYVHKKSKRVINSQNKYPDASMINEKFKYGLSDW